MARFSLILLTFFIAALVSNTQSRVTTIEDENIIETFDDTEKNSKNDGLEQKILDLKKKVNDLVEQGHENEKHFLAMSQKVETMNTRVKDMIKRLKKVNQADYLNAGAEEIKNL